MDDERILKDYLHKTNKEITKIKYEGEFFNNSELIEMIETLQHHIFLVHTYFDKSEFTADDVKIKLLEKLREP